MNQPLTPEQTKSPYQRVCEQECEFCASGVAMGPDGHHVDDAGLANWRFGRRCTAPSKDAFMERQAAKIAAMQVALAKAPHGADCASGYCSSCRLNEGACVHWHEGFDNLHDFTPRSCNCYLAGLSDDIERGKELLGAMEEIKRLKGGTK